MNGIGRTLLASAALVFSVSGASGQEADRLAYGSRAGMEVMVVGKSGIGTSKASIKVKLTRENAAEFCELYLGDTSAKCIKKVLKEDGSRLRPTVSGNCETRTWTDMHGDSYVMKGRSQTPSDMGADYVIQNRKTREILDGSMASGYSLALGVFEALCPKFKASRDLGAVSPSDARPIEELMEEAVNLKIEPSVPDPKMPGGERSSLEQRIADLERRLALTEERPRETEGGTSSTEENGNTLEWAPGKSDLCLPETGKERSFSPSSMTDKHLCKVATLADGSAWEADPEFAEYVKEASRRQLTPERCRDLAKASSTPGSPTDIP